MIGDDRSKVVSDVEYSLSEACEYVFCRVTVVGCDMELRIIV